MYLQVPYFHVHDSFLTKAHPFHGITDICLIIGGGLTNMLPLYSNLRYRILQVKKLKILFFRYITLMVSLPDLGLFFHADKTPEIVQDLFTVLSDNQLTHNPVIAHVFSNGGSMVYSHFTAALHDESYPKPHGLQLRLKGVVFDSTPSKFSICVTVKAMMETVRSSALFRYALGLSIFTFLIIFQPLSKVTDGGVDDVDMIL